MSKPVVFEGVHYKTIKKFEEFIEGELKRKFGAVFNGIVFDLPNSLENSDFSWLMVFLSRHPKWEQKSKSYIEKAQIQCDVAKKGFEVVLCYAGGLKDPISWRDAARGSGSTEKAAFDRAFRGTIVEQIFAFRDQEKAKSVEFRCSGVLAQGCPHKTVGSPSDGKLFHVDHEDPSFKDIVTSFLKDKANTWTYDDIVIHPNANLNTTVWKGEKGEQWRQYHRSKAKLRLLCENCHRGLSAKQKSASA